MEKSIVKVHHGGLLVFIFSIDFVAQASRHWNHFDHEQHVHVLDCPTKFWNCSAATITVATVHAVSESQVQLRPCLVFHHLVTAPLCLSGPVATLSTTIMCLAIHVQ